MMVVEESEKVYDGEESRGEVEWECGSGEALFTSPRIQENSWTTLCAQLTNKQTKQTNKH